METQKLEPEFEEVAKQIKKYFYEGKRDKHRKKYAPSEKFSNKELWNTAGQNCIRAGADPYSFVRASFLYNNVSGGPYPNQLCSNAAVRWYKQYRQVYGEDKDTQQDVYASEIKSLIKGAFLSAVTQKRKRVRDYLLDENVRLDDIPAFVRVLLLPKDSLVVEKWSRTAYGELIGNPRLIEILESLNYDLGFLQKMRN